MHSAYYSKQIISKLETVAENIADAISATSDVIVSSGTLNAICSGTVSVDNFPSSQTISGTVAVSSIPSVSGTVSITGTPNVNATCSGTVAVTNTPLSNLGDCINTSSHKVNITGDVTTSGTSTVSGTVAVSSIPSISGSVSITGTPNVNCSGTVAVSSVGGTVTTSGTATVSGTALTDIKDAIIHGFYSTEPGDLNIQDLYGNSQNMDGYLGSLTDIITPINNLGLCLDNTNHHVEVDLNALNGTMLDAGSGLKSAGCPRVVIANDDTNMRAISNILFDFRYYNLNSTPDFNKFTKVQAKINPPVFMYPTSGVATFMTNSGYSNPSIVMFADFICQLPNAGVNIILFPDASLNYSIPYDNCKIGAFSANDATSGSFARQVNLTYRDDNDVLQTVTHSLSNTSATYNIRRLINFEVVSWGANKFNEDTIYLYHSSTKYVAWIHQYCNQSFFNHISIPYNGFVVMDSLLVNCQSSATLTWRILLWKQTSASAYTFSVVFQKVTTGTTWFNFDLTYLPLIYGPTSSSENWALVLTAFGSGSIPLQVSMELNAKVKSQ